MKTEDEIRARIQELVHSEIARRVEEASQRLPHLCSHNHRHHLDARKRTNGDPNPTYNRVGNDKALPVVQSIGLCMLGAEDPSEWGGTICDEPLDAKRCPYYNPAVPPSELAKDLEVKMQDLEWVKTEVPEIHTLMWVLNEAQLPRRRWWQRLLLQWRRPRVEPLSPPFDHTKLLPRSIDSVSTMPL